MKSAARVRLDSNGVVTVETDMTDIGTGSYTIIAQTAAEMMGLPLDKVVVRLGDSAFPVSAGSGGQWGGEQLDRRRLCRLREAARGRCAEARLQFGRGRVQRRRGARRQPSHPAGARPRPTASSSARTRIEYRRPRQEVPAVDLRRAFRRGRRRCRHRRDPRAPHAGGLRRRPHPQSQDRAQPGDRRHDHGRGRCADGGAGGRQARTASSSTTISPATRCRCMPTFRTRR